MAYTIENSESDTLESVLLASQKGFDRDSIDSHVLNVQPINQTQPEVYFQIED
jgi:hypothetical protein